MSELLISTVDQIITVCKKVTKSSIEVGPQTSLINDLELDSVQALELIGDIEDACAVNIPSELLPEIETVADAARIVDKVKEENPLA